VCSDPTEHGGSLGVVTDVLIACEASWIIEDLKAALVAPGTTIRVVNTGAAVRGEVDAETPDLVILDLQIGNMGGMATCLDLRLEAGVGRLPHVPVLMLLDRAADVFLASSSDADGWIIKPLDAIRLRKAITSLLAGNTYHESQTAAAQ